MNKQFSKSRYKKFIYNDKVVAVPIEIAMRMKKMNPTDTVDILYLTDSDLVVDRASAHQDFDEFHIVKVSDLQEVEG
jgi:hypothetical protein